MLATTRRFAVMAVKSAEGADLDPWETPRVAGWGFGGQRLYIVPALQLVVAITAGLWDTGTQDMVALGILNRYVLPSVQG